MITIPSEELVSCVSDVIPFAETDIKQPGRSCVHLKWDGGRFHGQATDDDKLGWSSWTPNPDRGLGGTDDPWSATITLANAKALVTSFKLPMGRRWIPVTVERLPHGVRIQRAKQDSTPALSMVAADIHAAFPDLQAVLAGHDTIIVPVGTIALSAADLALFAKVRPYGQLRVSFTGQHSPVIVTIGHRFTASIQPTPPPSRGEWL